MRESLSLMVLVFVVSIKAVFSGVYFLRFKNESYFEEEMANNSILKNSGNRTILYEFPDECLAIMRLTKKQAKEYIKNPRIQFVKRDETFQIPAFLRSSSSTSDVSLVNGEVPYGIEMIQALEIGNPKSNMAICIV